MGSQGSASARTGRSGTRAVAAILSDDLAWTNGTHIEVSGGQKI
jgi:hypothetical protein